MGGFKLLLLETESGYIWYKSGSGWGSFLLIGQHKILSAHKWRPNSMILGSSCPIKLPPLSLIWYCEQFLWQKPWLTLFEILLWWPDTPRAPAVVNISCKFYLNTSFASTVRFKNTCVLSSGFDLYISSGIFQRLGYVGFLSHRVRQLQSSGLQ